MRWWEQSIGGVAKGRLIRLLRRGRRTVDELAESSGVTDNAVRAQLHLLQEAGVVRAAGTRQPEGAGKPATLYEIDPRAEASLSSAYAPVLSAIVGSLSERMSAADVESVLRDAGRRLASGSGQGKRSLASRVDTAAGVLTSLGGEVDVERTDTGYRLCGYACPLATAVRQDERICVVVEELLCSLVGETVTECCDRSDGARCRFDITVA
jgi:predicted ArsR family transcriptional regulator